MQVSRLSKTPRHFRRNAVATGVVLALASPALMAQQEPKQQVAIEEIVTTAQKREQSLQDVPISIQMLGSEAIEELNIQKFEDYVKMLPSVAFLPSLGGGGSFNGVYMRGVASAGDGQATTSLPSVGMYLDELPITTIQGNLNVHMYDIARVEALAGPQGTLYGASSQAGTIRVITNRPDFDEFAGSVSLEANTVNEGGTGWVGEGMVNIPIGDRAAVRLVGWLRDEAGWIDNVAGTRTFPGVLSTTADDVILDNSDIAKDDYNTVEVAGARAALRVDLNDRWTMTATAMGQKTEQEGSWGDDLSDILQTGDYAVTHFKDEFTDDEWSMVGLTIEGAIGNFDVVYAGSYLDRQVDGSYDYSDYSYWYDTIYTTGYYADLHFAATGLRAVQNQFVPAYFDAEDVGTRIMSGARFTNNDGYTKQNHEIRISTDASKKVRGTLGYFWQHQYHDFVQNWIVDGGLAPVMEMNGGTDPRFDDVVYLNSLFRNDRDRAIFASVSVDLSDTVEMTVGTRYFEPSVTVRGFFGFGLGFTPIWSSNGENRCNLMEGDDGWTPRFNGQADYFDKPCLNVDKGIDESDNVSRINFTWDVSADNMVYFTWSEGYRPGGINRNPAAGEYVSDFLTNIEAGWKTRWLDNRLQFNGAVFDEEWEDFQISFTGANAITQVANGPTASIFGIEADLLWLPTDNLRVTAGVAFYDTELEDDYCNFDNAGNCVEVLAPKGTSLPVTADFKGNLIVRQNFQAGGFDAFVQGALAHEGKRGSDMDQSANDIRGDVPAYTTLDLSGGIIKDDWSLELFINNATEEDAPLYLTGQCTAETCGAQNYGVRIRPRTIALKYTKDF